MPRNSGRTVRASRFWSPEGAEVEFLIAGVLAIVLALALVRALLPVLALPLVATAAFAGLAGIGFLVHRVRPARGAVSDWLLGAAAVLAIAWIAGGRLLLADF